MNNIHIKKCPFCGEEIKAEAIKCRYCREFLDTVPPATAENSPQLGPQEPAATPVPPPEKGNGMNPSAPSLPETPQNSPQPEPSAPLTASVLPEEEHKEGKNTVGQSAPGTKIPDGSDNAPSRENPTPRKPLLGCIIAVCIVVGFIIFAAWNSPVNEAMDAARRAQKDFADFNEWMREQLQQCPIRDKETLESLHDKTMEIMKQGDIRDRKERILLCIGDTFLSKDPAEAVKWYLKAAEQGYAPAQFKLGVCYYNGKGVAKDPAEAVKWYRKAAEQGYAPAQFNLGVCYYFGNGVTKDPAEAAQWCRKAAEQGHAKAQLNLGFCYYFGNGVTKDPAEAVKWYRKAAEQGHAEAQFNLGICYYNGKGVAKDTVEAAQWFRKAAEQGLAEAQNRYGACCQEGEGVEKDLKKAVYWYRKSAEQGFAKAQYNLGICFEYGLGVEKDMYQAAEWYRKAAEQGFEPAKQALKKMGK